MDNSVLEFSKVCNDLQLNIKEVNTFVKSLIQQLESYPVDCFKSGLSLLDVKNDLLNTYLMDIVYLILRKCNGHRIESDKAIERLVESRVVLEKITPIEQKLKYQIEKLVKISLTNEPDYTDKTHFKPNPADMQDDSTECSDDDTSNTKKAKKSGEYVPPKLASVPYDDDSIATKRQKLLERAKKRALNTSVIQELKEEYLDIPVEISHTNTLRNTRLKCDEEREKFEETYFTRLPVSKEEKRKRKMLSSFTMGQLGSDVTRFEDISVLEGNLAQLDKLQRKKRKSNTNNKKRKSGSFKRRKTK